MKQFALSPNKGESKHRTKDILGRTAAATLGLAGIVVGTKIGLSSAEAGPKLAGMIISAVGLFSVSASVICELDERGYGTTGKDNGHGGGGGGRGWEPPERPQDPGPGGIPIDTKWVEAVEEFANSHSLEPA